MGKWIKWTKELCHKEALKCETKTEFLTKYSHAYKKSCKNKWIDEICIHMKNLKKF